MRHHVTTVVALLIAAGFLFPALPAATARRSLPRRPA